MKSPIAPLRSFVAEPMRFGRLFLVVTLPISCRRRAKGLNLAASDVHYLLAGLLEHTRTRAMPRSIAYSERAFEAGLEKPCVLLSMTTLLHRFPDTGDFGQKIQEAELDYLTPSRAASTAMAENYVGLPY